LTIEFVTPADCFTRYPTAPNSKTAFARNAPALTAGVFFCLDHARGKGAEFPALVVSQLQTKKAPSRPLDAYRRLGSMNTILDRVPAQAGSTPPRDRFVTADLTAQEALAIAGDRFGNLSSIGIRGSKQPAGPPIDLADIDRAMAFLRQCRKTKQPNTHTVDLVAAIGASLGAVIAAATALGFGVHSFYGPLIYAPNALVAVSKVDVRRLANRRS
jgi:hypothetical protein